MIMQTQLEHLWKALAGDRYKYRVYLFLNRPRTCIAIGYQVLVGLLILACMVFTILLTRRESFMNYWLLFWFDLSVTIIFAIEYVARVWASTCLPKYRDCRSILWLLVHPIYILDLLVLVSTVIVLVFDVRETMLAVGLRGFRMLHFFENRFVLICACCSVRSARCLSPITSLLAHGYRYHLWRIIGSVVWSQRFQLAIVAYFGLVWLFLISFLLYFVEAPINKEFNTVANSFWFTLVTFTTVGYGDMGPISTAGKIITSIGIVVGVSIFALPGGVIGAGLALKVEEEDSSKQMNLRRTLAATMVQQAWRIFRIKRDLAHSNQQLIIRMSSNKQTIHFLYKNGHPEPYVHPYIVQFISMLRFLVSKRKFKFANYLCETFYETYTQNTLSYNEAIRNVQAQLHRIEEVTNNTHQILDALKKMGSTFGQSENRVEKVNDCTDLVKPIKKHHNKLSGCWSCHQRRVHSKMRSKPKLKSQWL